MKWGQGPPPAHCARPWAGSSGGALWGSSGKRFAHRSRLRPRREPLDFQTADCDGNAAGYEARRPRHRRPACVCFSPAVRATPSDRAPVRRWPGGAPFRFAPHMTLEPGSVHALPRRARGGSGGRATFRGLRQNIQLADQSPWPSRADRRARPRSPPKEAAGTMAGARPASQSLVDAGLRRQPTATPADSASGWEPPERPLAAGPSAASPAAADGAAARPPLMTGAGGGWGRTEGSRPRRPPRRPAGGVTALRAAAARQPGG